MNIVAVICGLAILTGCGAEGDPLRPTAGLGIGIGLGGIKIRPNVGLTDGTSKVAVGAGGVTAGTKAGPVSVGGAL